MIEVTKYDLSFTSLSLRANDMFKVARSLVADSSFDYLNELGYGKEATGIRHYREIKKRLENLSEFQLELFLKADLITKKQIAFLAVCKTYTFIRDFCVEVLKEKLLVYDYDITEGEFISFYRRKYEIHPEMESLTDKTENKIKQVTFKILEQAGIINNIKERILQPQLLSNEIVQAIVSDNKEWLKVFMLSDEEINNLS